MPKATRPIANVVNEAFPMFCVTSSASLVSARDKRAGRFPLPTMI